MPEPFTTEAITQVQRSLLAWYRAIARDLPWRRTRDPYAIWVSEIMLQQTRVATVIPYYERFLGELPTIEHLAGADDDTLHRLWQGLGYYRRASLLRKGAQHLQEHFGGKLPRTYGELLGVPGFGPYTAGAVASIAFGEPVAAVDGNVIRVFSRWLNDDTPLDKLRVRLQRGEADAWVAAEDPAAWNQAVMELGATTCLPRKPACKLCPLTAHCKAHAAGTAPSLPVKGKETRHVVLDMVATVYRRRHEVWVEKRETGGLLAGLPGFPIVEVAESPEALEAGGYEGLRYRHVFTHRTWNVTVRVIDGNPPAESEGRWLPLARLEDEPVPTAFLPIVRWLVEPGLFT